MKQIKFLSCNTEWVCCIEEGREASKSGYFLSISQQGVSADITKISSVGNIMQYLNHEYLGPGKQMAKTWFGLEK
jgi:hypothetical protein